MAPTLDRRIRHRIYSALAQGAPIPTAASLAATFGIPAADVRESLERLHTAHLLVLDEETREVRMASPFSGVPTAYRVEGHGTSWDANCAWDALALTRLLRARPGSSTRAETGARDGS
jgi:predicted ArsR family transcriptional regulator